MIRITHIFLAMGIFFATTAFSSQVLAVLEIIPNPGLDVSIQEMRHLTDELRRQATQVSQNTYSVLTRDNILQLMPTDEKEAECLAESCAVDIGRAIGAEYISQGRIGRFGRDLSLSIELYETMSGKLIGSIVMESQDMKGLLTAIREQAPSLFGEINVKPEVETKKISQPRASSERKIKTSTYIAVSLDVLGAAALGFGIYQQFNQKKLYKDYKNLDPARNAESEFSKALDKANNAKTLRDAGFIVGSALLASGIAVHIWF